MQNSIFFFRTHRSYKRNDISDHLSQTKWIPNQTICMHLESRGKNGISSLFVTVYTARWFSCFISNAIEINQIGCWYLIEYKKKVHFKSEYIIKWHNNLVDIECYATHLLLIILRYVQSTNRLMKFIKCNGVQCAHTYTRFSNILCTIPHPIKVHNFSLSGRISNPSSNKVRFFRLCFACDVKWLTGSARKGQQKGWLQSQQITTNKQQQILSLNRSYWHAHSVFVEKLRMFQQDIARIEKCLSTVSNLQQIGCTVAHIWYARVYLPYSRVKTLTPPFLQHIKQYHKMTLRFLCAFRLDVFPSFLGGFFVLLQQTIRL